MFTKSLITLIALFMVKANFCFCQVYCSDMPSETRNIWRAVGAEAVSGNYSIWFKCKDGITDNKITKPFIICEGYDALNSINPKNTFDQVNNDNLNFLQCLRQRGFDVIVLNLENNTVAIEKNAELFRVLIKDINAGLANNGSKHRIVTCGVSMGGQVIKYALAEMESLGEDHRVETYISFDSPHQGANIPLGYQHLIDTWLGWLLTGLEAFSALDRFYINPLIIFGDNFLDDYGHFFIQTAAFEMSAVYVNQNFNRLLYLNNLDGIGNYPQKCRKVAISNGAIGKNQGFNAGSVMVDWQPGIKLVDKTYDFGIFGDIHLEWAPLIMHSQFNAMPGDYSGRVYFSNIEVQPFINFSKISIAGVNKYSYDRDYLVALAYPNLVPSANPNMDHVPGGNFRLDFLSDFATFINTGNLHVPLEWAQEICIPTIFWGDICQTFSIDLSFDIPYHEVIGRLTSPSDYTFCYVPMLSAFDVNNNYANGNWFYDVSTIPSYPYPKNKNITPFDALCPSTNNTRHPYLEESRMAGFLKEEVAPEHLYIQNKTFEPGYTNIFEANDITIGRNVDPVKNRSEIGDVVLDPSDDIEFLASATGKVEVKEGFQTNGAKVTIGNSDKPAYSDCSSLNFTPLARKAKEEIKKEEPPVDWSKPKLNPKITVTFSDKSEKKDGIRLPSQNSYPPIDYIQAKIFPNPVIDNGKIVILVLKEGNVSIDIYNATGNYFTQVLENTILTPSVYTYDLDVSGLAKGFYFCRIEHNGRIYNKKLVLQ